MKKLMIIGLVLGLIFICGCVSPAETDIDTEVEIELSELDELEGLIDELEDDLGLDELEDLSFE